MKEDGIIGEDRAELSHDKSMLSSNAFDETDNLTLASSRGTTAQNMSHILWEDDEDDDI